MPVEVLTNPTTSNLKKIEVVIQPGVGGRYEPNLSLDNIEVIARPTDPNSPPTSPQQPENFTTVDHATYMRTVVQRRWEFYSSLGLLEDLSVVRNYDIPLVRVMWEQMKTDEQKKLWVEHETNEALAALGERYNLVEMTPRYLIDNDGKLRYAPFPIEPFEDADRRAIEHYRNLKSPDAIREEAGHKGRLKIQQKMADPNTPIGFTMAVISGPGLAEGSLQQHNFVWFFVLKENPLTGEKIVEMTPSNSTAAYSQYEENVAQINPEYFKGRVSPIDLHFLENPLDFESKSIPEIFTLLTGETKDHKPNEAFRQFAEENKPRIRYYLESVCSAIFDPHEAAKRWYAVVAGADLIWRQLNRIGEKVARGVSDVLKIIPTFTTMAEEITYLARQKIEEIMAACGLSGGFSFGGIVRKVGRFITKLGKGIARILGTGGESKWFVCPRCEYEANGPVGNTCPNCSLTKEEYARIGGKTC